MVVQRCQNAKQMNPEQAKTLNYQIHSHEKQQKFDEAYEDMTNILYSCDTIFVCVCVCVCVCG